MATHHASVRIAAIRLQASLNPHMTYSLPIIYVEISMPFVPQASATPFAPDGLLAQNLCYGLRANRPRGHIWDGIVMTGPVRT